MARTRRIVLWLRLLAGLLLTCWALGCLVTPDDRLWRFRNDAVPDARDAAPPDKPKPDVARDLTPDGQCSATGSPTTCDPVQVSGCLAGSCYIILNKGSSCVCPEGTAATGDPCNTTAECAPGNVCAGTVAPGTCRATCDTASPNCDATETCNAINGLPQWGYCTP